MLSSSDEEEKSEKKFACTLGAIEMMREERVSLGRRNKEGRPILSPHRVRFVAVHVDDDDALDDG